MNAARNGYEPAPCDKGSLGFIMNWLEDDECGEDDGCGEDDEFDQEEGEDDEFEEEEDAVAAAAGFDRCGGSQSRLLEADTSPMSEMLALGATAAVIRAAGMKNRPPTCEEKRRARECRVEGCENYIINRGLCFRHGGGKKCSADDCQSSAKNGGLCWRHGGSVKCLMEGCERRGKSRGLCWAHGGGTKCSHARCSKVAVSNGFCWAHGGGKRCVYDGCKKAAYERTHNYCVKHHELLKDGFETLEV